MTFGAVWSRRLNCFLSQSAYAFNLSNFFALNLIACGQVLGLSIQIEICQKCLNMNFLVMFSWLCTFFWEEIFLWNRRLACTCFNFMLPYLIWNFEYETAEKDDALRRTLQGCNFMIHAGAWNLSLRRGAKGYANRDARQNEQLHLKRVSFPAV